MSSEQPEGARRLGRKRRRLRRIRPKRVRVRGPSFNRLIPNLLTMLGLCAGLSSLRYGLEHQFSYAAIALVIAACIDGLDGRIARLLHGTSRFGAEFDSLSDFVCFGVAPPFLLYLWTLHEEGGRYGFVPCILFTVCMALRLARFNASSMTKTSRNIPTTSSPGSPLRLVLASCSSRSFSALKPRRCIGLCSTTSRARPFWQQAL